MCLYVNVCVPTRNSSFLFHLCLMILQSLFCLSDLKYLIWQAEMDLSFNKTTYFCFRNYETHPAGACHWALKMIIILKQRVYWGPATFPATSGSWQILTLKEWTSSLWVPGCQGAVRIFTDSLGTEIKCETADNLFGFSRNHEAFSRAICTRAKL